VCVAKRLLVVQVQVGYVCGVCVVERLLAMHVQVGCVWCVRGRALAGCASAGGLRVWCVRGRALACRASAGGLRVVCAWSSACWSCKCRWVVCGVCVAERLLVVYVYVCCVCGVCVVERLQVVHVQVGCVCGVRLVCTQPCKCRYDTCPIHSSVRHLCLLAPRFCNHARQQRT